MKSILIIGLGRFGSHICMILHDMGHKILVVDTSEERVQKMLPYATNGLVADSTDKSFLESLGIPNFDICLVTIGDDFQSSMETTALLKDLGAKLVVSRASRGIHEKLLRRCGADVTVYPEKQTAFLTALRYGSDSLFEYFIISKDYAVCEVAIPQAWIGKTVGDLNIRKNYHINILALKKGEELTAEITPQTVFTEDHTILILGKKETLEQFY